MKRMILLIFLLIAVLVSMILMQRGKRTSEEEPPLPQSVSVPDPVTAEPETETKTQQVFATKKAYSVLRDENKAVMTSLGDSGVQIRVMQPTASGGSEQTAEYVFTDVFADDWFAPAVAFAMSENLFRGVIPADSREFRPEYGLTRAEFASILYYFAGGVPMKNNVKYDDVSEESTYYNAICWADGKGLLVGPDTGSFGVDNYLTCEQALIVMRRLAGDPKVTTTLEGYPYAPKVSPYGEDAVAWAWSVGLIEEDDCVWYPTQTLSRAQVVQMLYHFSHLAEQNAET